jgi:endonuclease YncB( thermonuclease family)
VIYAFSVLLVQSMLIEQILLLNGPVFGGQVSDTIKINGTKIRLHGIDAPERKQECSKDGKSYLCGMEATAHLKKLINNQTVSCIPSGTDRYKRTIAVCFVDTVNLNEAMVAHGWALAYRRYSKDYVNAESLAQRDRNGIWRGEFIPPWKWRKVKN